MNELQVVHLCRGRDWRGGERQVRLLARMLADRSDLSQLIATGRTSRLAGVALSDGQRVLPLTWAQAYDPRAWLSLVRQLHRLQRRGAGLLLHAHDSHGLALGLLAATLLRLPLVATRRSMSVAGPLWRRPRRVIAISRAVEQELLESGVSRRRIVRISSAIDLAVVRRVVPTQDPREETLIAVGALTPEKGHATLIDAVELVARTHPGIRLRIFGEGTERGALEAQAGRAGLGSRVVLAGETETAAAQIAAAQLFIQPSHREALGTAVLDAMALGVPVVASDTGGLTELLDGGAGMLVPPKDPVALAAAIEMLLASQQLRTEIAAAARARVAEFDAPGMADRVVEVYRSALGDT